MFSMDIFAGEFCGNFDELEEVKLSNEDGVVFCAGELGGVREVIGTSVNGKSVNGISLHISV